MEMHATQNGMHEALCRLLDFVHAHPEIKAEKRSLSVPGEIRSDFYELVAEAQEDAVRRILSNQLEALTEIGSLCNQERKALTASSGLCEFNFASAVEAAIADPLAAVSKPVFSVVLDVVQGSVPLEEFEQASKEALIPYCESLWRNTYEAWAYCGILVSLAPARFFKVVSPDTVHVHAVGTDSVTIGQQITSPERRIPEAVFETGDGQVFAVKSEVARELDYYGSKIVRRRDFSAGGNTVDHTAHRVLMLYKFESVDDVSLIADRDKSYILTNDLMCEVLLPGEMGKPAFLSWFVDRIKTVRSKRPIQVITCSAEGGFPEELLVDSSVPAIQRRIVGFDRMRLHEIAQLLTCM